MTRAEIVDVRGCTQAGCELIVEDGVSTVAHSTICPLYRKPYTPPAIESRSLSSIDTRAIEMALAWREFREAFRAVLMNAPQRASTHHATAVMTRMDDACECLTSELVAAGHHVRSHERR